MRSCSRRSESLAGARRFDDFKRRMDAADNVLSSRLSSMVSSGLLETRAYTTGPRPRVEYLPTRAATDALPILQAYAAWAHEHRPSENEDPTFAVICGACGVASDRSEVCEHCGALLDVDNEVAWQRPGLWEGRVVTLG